MNASVQQGSCYPLIAPLPGVRFQNSSAYPRSDAVPTTGGISEFGSADGEFQRLTRRSGAAAAWRPDEFISMPVRLPKSHLFSLSPLVYCSVFYSYGGDRSRRDTGVIVSDGPPSSWNEDWLFRRTGLSDELAFPRRRR